LDNHEGHGIIYMSDEIGDRDMVYQTRQRTVKATQKLVVQDTAPDEQGMVTIRYQSDGHTEQVHESEITRLRKYVRGVLLDVYFCGTWTEGKQTYRTPRTEGVVWTCFCPVGNSLSAWVRLEAEGYRPRMVYDPGNHWRRTLDNRIN
jgi:hypothetical protein